MNSGFKSGEFEHTNKLKRPYKYSLTEFDENMIMMKIFYELKTNL